MKISYDAEVDALAIQFRETTVETREVGDGIGVDYDAEGRVAGIEILDARSRLADGSTLDEVVLEGLGRKQA